MTTLSDRPNTALVVIDVQNGVVDGAHERDRSSPTSAALVDKARERRRTGRLGAALDENLPKGSDGWQYVGADARGLRAAGAQDLWRLVRGH